MSQAKKISVLLKESPFWMTPSKIAEALSLNEQDVYYFLQYMVCNSKYGCWAGIKREYRLTDSGDYITCYTIFEDSY
jgi:hypothetical protein